MAEPEAGALAVVMLSGCPDVAVGLFLRLSVCFFIMPENSRR